MALSSTDKSEASFIFTMKFRTNLHTIEVRHRMAAFSRGLRSIGPVQTLDYVCARCLQFSTYSGLRSGHNRWSKIKHDKAGVDAKKNRQRSIFSNELTTISKRELSLYISSVDAQPDFTLTDCSQLVYGGDPATNTRLATVIATAKKGT